MKFTKMHGLGNDFMVVDAIHQSIVLTAEQIAKLADRHFGIGFDQCLLIEESRDDGVDFFYRIFNADGSEVGQCGNGARCLARFIKRYFNTPKDTFRVKTQTTEMILQLHSDDTVTVDMGVPQFKNSVQEELILNKTPHSFYTVDVGNPHAVLLVNDTRNAPVHTLGKELSQHAYFPNQCNIGFMQILTPDAIQLRVYERGCGETLACGSGAIAAAVIGMRYFQLAEEVTVHLPGGELLVSWPDRNASVSLRGAATFVYDGTLIGLDHDTRSNMHKVIG